MSDDILSVLASDSTVVMLNMMRGGIAKPTPSQLTRLYSADDLEAAAQLARRIEENGGA